MAPSLTLGNENPGGETTTASRLAATVAGSKDHSGHFKKLVGNTTSAIQHHQSNGTPDYVLAPDVTIEHFEGFLKDARSIVGDEHVHVNISSKGEDQEKGDYLNMPRYTDFFPINDAEKYMASAHIQPANVEQVQKVVEAANKYGQPLHPISIGRNLGYGGSSPRLRGTTILDLKRMNKILEINETSGYALLEPGVSYFELYEHLQRIGSKLWVDCPDIGWGSVVGNACDRGAGYTPMGDHFLFHCGMEVVLPTGKLVRTGMGALPGNDTWQTFQYGFGPYHDGIFTQSSLGIVTKVCERDSKRSD
jgi:FAD/FMN-containing dehydrogenase